MKMFKKALFNRRSEEEALDASIDLNLRRGSVYAGFECFCLRQISNGNYVGFSESLDSKNFSDDNLWRFKIDFLEDVVKLKSMLQFLKLFDKNFSEKIENPKPGFKGRNAAIAVGNVIDLMKYQEKLGFEESIIILNAFGEMISKVIDETDDYEIKLNAKNAAFNIDFCKLILCEKYDVFEREFLQLLSRFFDSDGENQWIKTLMMEYNPRCDEIINFGISRILRSKLKLTKEEKDIIFEAYEAMKQKGYVFSPIERIKLSLFLF